MTKSNDAGRSPALVETVAGLSAGTMATLIVHPLDIVKTRMQIHRSITSPNATLTTVSVIRSLARTDRPLAALYRGLTPNLLGNATSWASFFFFKSLAERALIFAHARYAAPSSSNPHSGTTTPHRLTPTDFFFASLAAGTATQIITNPIWVLKTRMLASDSSAVGAYPSMWTGAARLYRAEGIKGFYRGLGVGMLAVSHGAVQFAVYDPARRMYLARRKRQSGVEEAGHMENEATVVLSTVAKLVAGATTYPLQVLRSRLQHYEADEMFGRGVVGVGVGEWTQDQAV
ncbi:mitochondrial carrier domain-containing protein [Podospora aff. communis PSN243]|uniref:Mitochondrial carrier domain-containing protein n=1 Tax=Podospora aff. communis PSN243 TaxID=3040156 RepID=A0AAV9H4E4_9PEZI|nr:mitochondrial carrier domain-containing protein [Podospora aff. communis PSN243]